MFFPVVVVLLFHQSRNGLAHIYTLLSFVTVLVQNIFNGQFV